MKSICSLLFVLLIFAARADSTNLPPANIALSPTNAATPVHDIDQWSLSGFVRQPDLTPLLTLKQRPNEVQLGKVNLSGSLVEAAKSDNPLQLFNPWAPREYGESQDNATFSLITNQVTGWKLFALEF